MVAFVWATVGALAAAGLVWVGRRLRDAAEHRAWAAGLVVVALVYVGFALARAAPPLATAFEAGGVAVFAAFAGLGVARDRRWLAAGWLLHPAWDLLHAPGGFALAPAAYVWLCLGFDVVAGAALWPNATPRSA